MSPRLGRTSEFVSLNRLPPLDAHAHIDTRIDFDEINRLNAVILAMTRSLDEGDVATLRNDRMAIWGIGCHPGLQRAQNEFDIERFEGLLSRTAVAGELGLDGKSRVPMATQIDTLSKALDCLRRTPRLVSLHSFSAAGPVLELLETNPPPGVILHWWLGNDFQTNRAVDLGCYFSINDASTRRSGLLARIPKDRILTETDHPFGDRRTRPQRPGNVASVESAIGLLHGMQSETVRELVWTNLRQLVIDVGCLNLLPPNLRKTLIADA